MDVPLISLIISFIISYIVVYIVNFYIKVRQYPRGPLPLPLLGNIYKFHRTKTHPMKTLMELSKKYGPIFTFWLGNDPFVFIFDLQLAKEAFTKSVFSGRPQTEAAKLVCNDKGVDILMADYSKEWEFLRRASHSAVKKFANNQMLDKLAIEVMDKLVEQMISNQVMGKPFSPNIYIQLAIYNFIAMSAFGKRYTLEDPEFLTIHKINKTFFELGYKLALIKFVPILRLPLILYLSKYKWTDKEYIRSSKIIMDKYEAHLNNYENGVTRDFADALINAKLEAKAKEKESAGFLTDYNLSLALWDLFNAGTDTILFAFQWTILLMANYPEFQRRLRLEVETMIGSDMPSQDDKNKCDYVMAFITEVLRFRAVSPLGAIHKTMDNIEIANYKLLKNTNVIVHLFSICNDSNYWSNPETFNPERFLINGSYTATRPQAYIPFGIGRRMCIGDKLAFAELFIVLVRFLQNTKGYEISLPNGERSADLEPDPNSVMLFSVPICVPKPYEIVINKQNFL